MSEFAPGFCMAVNLGIIGESENINCTTWQGAKKGVMRV